MPVLAWTLFPIFWITTASFKTELALYARPPQWLFTPILDNYTRVLDQHPVRPVPDEQPGDRHRHDGRQPGPGDPRPATALPAFASGSEAVRFLVLVTRMAPRVVLVVPYFLLMQRLGLLDTYTGLLVAYVSFALPFAIWLLIGFFGDIPLEIEEAALIDGCSRSGSCSGSSSPSPPPGWWWPPSSASWRPGTSSCSR